MLWTFIKNLFFGQGIFPSKKTLSEPEKEKIRSEWRQVEELVKLGSPSNIKQAVIKADKVLEYALTRITGQDYLAGALKISRDLFSSSRVYDDLWSAHKIRNMLVHDINSEPNHYSLTRTIKRFRTGLMELIDGL